MKEFYLLPVGDKLIQYDTIAVNTIVKNSDGEVSSCDILFEEELNRFNSDYLKYTKQVAATCKDRDDFISIPPHTDGWRIRRKVFNSHAI